MNWLNRVQRWRKQNLLRQHRIPLRLWKRVSEDVLEHYHLDYHELHRLRELTSLFLHAKVITGAGGLELDTYMRTVIAAKACILILNLDLDYYDGWKEIIVYPDSFVITREGQDEIGVVHEQHAALGGESWNRGPVVLAWEDARLGTQPHGMGSNIILHEFAHKLDMLDGAANGIPPLHADMEHSSWTQIFTHAYSELQEQILRHQRTRIDPYGAVNPAEFFAVATEEFFELPEQLHSGYPDVYRQLSLFYRQDPLKRLPDKRTK